MFSLKFRDVLPTPVLDELESLINQLKGFLRISFNEDGTLIGTTGGLNLVPIGATQAWLTDTPPTGWLLLDGSQKNRVTYKSLFELWGTTYGAGDGSTTFTLPDMRGRFFLGKAAAGTGSALGATGGSLDHTHTTPAGTSGATAPTVSGSTAGATATVSGTTATEAAHTHGYSGTVDVSISFAASGPDNSTLAFSTSGHQHTYSGTTGAGSSHAHGAGSLGVDSHAHGSGSLAVSSHTHTTPAGTSGAENPAYFAGNWIAFSGV